MEINSLRDAFERGRRVCACVSGPAPQLLEEGSGLSSYIVFLQNRLIFIQSQNMLVAKRLVFILVSAYLFFDIFVFGDTRWLSAVSSALTD